MYPVNPATLTPVLEAIHERHNAACPWTLCSACMFCATYARPAGAKLRQLAADGPETSGELSIALEEVLTNSLEAEDGNTEPPEAPLYG